MRIDYGFKAGTKTIAISGESFASRAFPKGRANENHHYSPIIRASGTHVPGKDIDGASIQPRTPWVLLNNYNSNGYRNVVAGEDQGWFAISSRNLIQDDIVPPMFDNNSKIISYSLEPPILPNILQVRSNIGWVGDKGQLTVEVTAPDGNTTSLGTYPFVALSGRWPTTKKSAVTAWKPSMYGRYTLPGLTRFCPQPLL